MINITELNSCSRSLTEIFSNSSLPVLTQQSREIIAIRLQCNEDHLISTTETNLNSHRAVAAVLLPAN